MNKKKFRMLCIKRLKRQDEISSYKLDKLMIQRLHLYIKKHKVKTIMLYIPLKIEVNINSLIKILRMEKKTLLVPFMEGESFRLVKYRLPLDVKKFGVKEPRNSNRYKRRIDLAIVPTIGVDKRFRRIGFGRGFYDRFYEKNHKRIKEVLFISRVNCFYSEEITDDFDIKANIYMTPKKTVFKQKN